MTTVAYRDGILAADSRYTEQSESGGDRVFQSKKLYTIDLPKIPDRFQIRAYIGLAGGQAGLTFLRWVRNGMDYDSKPEFGKADDFSAIVVLLSLGSRGGLTVAVYDTYCEPEPVMEHYHAIGSGAKCAFTAMDCGKSAEEAVELAAERDPWTSSPFFKLTCRE